MPDKMSVESVRACEHLSLFLVAREMGQCEEGKGRICSGGVGLLYRVICFFWVHSSATFVCFAGDEVVYICLLLRLRVDVMQYMRIYTCCEMCLFFFSVLRLKNCACKL